MSALLPADLVGPALVALGLLLGSIPFALVVGRLLLGVDPRRYGDGNPGAANVGRAGGRAAGALAAILDIAKGVAPVSLAVAWGLEGPWLTAAILAPVIAHVWTPWLRGHGGKGTATTYGVLIPVTLPAGPVVMPLLLLAAYRLVAPDGWAPVFGLAFVALGLLTFGGRPEVLAAVVCLGALVAFRYGSDLRTGIRLRRAGVR